jgi:hypothetical protein
MRRIVGVGVVLLLAALLIPSAAFGQQGGSERAKSRLGLNYPNPFNPETTIPFTLFEEDFASGRPVVVTLRIRNILGELVAVPEALHHSAGGRPEVLNLQYTTPGEKQAYWNGLNRLGQKVASGPYVLELVINGERAPPRIILVAK